MVEYNTNYENISQYKLKKELGRGTHAIVYEAEKINAEGIVKKFAVKVMTCEDPAKREVLMTFM